MIEENDGNWDLAAASGTDYPRRIAATSVPISPPDGEIKFGFALAGHTQELGENLPECLELCGVITVTLLGDVP